MKKTIHVILLLLGVLSFAACSKYETYADLKAKEQDAIRNFISKQNITVIGEIAFAENGYTTDVSKNEYVYFSRNGVYMQIVRKGSGEKLENKKTTNVLCRFLEKNLLTDSILVRNDIRAYLTTTSYGTIDVSQYVDKMTVYRSGTTFTASFVEGMMSMFHGSASVPSGWLVPLSYVNVPFPITESDDAETAFVKLIVPHSQGTSDASSSVYPCYYEITYQRDS